jgi:hypothetical protein
MTNWKVQTCAQVYQYPVSRMYWIRYQSHIWSISQDRLLKGHSSRPAWACHLCRMTVLCREDYTGTRNWLCMYANFRVQLSKESSCLSAYSIFETTAGISTVLETGGSILGFPSNMRPVGLEVLTAEVRKSSVFLDITTCSPMKVSWRFGGTHPLHLQGRRISQARK